MPDTNLGGVPSYGDPPQRSAITILITCLIPLATIALLVWSAWPMLRPAREVRVAQAVFDRSVGVGVVDASGSESSPAGSRRTTTVQAAGWLEGEPFYVACTGLADGVLESVDVLEGDQVEAGQVVARLVAEDSELRLRQAEAELANAEAELSLEQAELDAARRWWDEPIELRRRVATREAAMAESEAELAQLPALIGEAYADLLRREEELRRVELSFKANAANELEVVIFRQHVAAQREAHRAVEARRPILEARVDRLAAELQAAQRDLELRIDDRRRVDTAQANVLRAKAAVQKATAVGDEAALELERMVIRAPITGYVQQRLKVPGDKVIRMMDSPHSAHVLHLYDPARIQVRVDVPLADASNVYVGQTGEVIVEVLPDRVFRGEVLRITHEADLQKNTLEIKVKVMEPDPILRPEMLTRVKFIGSDGAKREGDRGAARNRHQLLVPSAAVAVRDGSSYVWTVTDRQHGRGVLQAVKVEPVAQPDNHNEVAANGWMKVSGDLQPGTLLSLETNNIEDGALVKIVSQQIDSEGGGS